MIEGSKLSPSLIKNIESFSLFSFQIPSFSTDIYPSASLPRRIRSVRRRRGQLERGRGPGRQNEDIFSLQRPRSPPKDFFFFYSSPFPSLGPPRSLLLLSLRLLSYIKETKRSARSSIKSLPFPKVALRSPHIYRGVSKFQFPHFKTCFDYRPGE